MEILLRFEKFAKEVHAELALRSAAEP